MAGAVAEAAKRLDSTLGTWESAVGVAVGVMAAREERSESCDATAWRRWRLGAADAPTARVRKVVKEGIVVEVTAREKR